MRRLALPLLALFALAAAAPAPASPSTDAFDALVPELNARDEALPATGLTKEQRRQKAALGKSFRALAADSGDLADDLKMAGRIAKALDAGFPGDGTLGGLMDAALDFLDGLVRDERDGLEVALSLLAEGKYQAKAADALADADAALLLADGATVRTQRAKLLGKALTAVERGLAAAAKADPGGPGGTSAMEATVSGSAWEANDQFGTAVDGLATVNTERNGLRRIVIRGRRILPKSGSGDPPLPGEATTLELTLTASTSDIVAGSFPIGAGSDVAASANWTREEEDGDLHYAIAISGTITLTALDVNLGSVSATGTFALTMYDGDTSSTFPVTSGTFEAHGIGRTEEE